LCVLLSYKSMKWKIIYGIKNLLNLITCMACIVSLVGFLKFTWFFLIESCFFTNFILELTGDWTFKFVFSRLSPQVLHVNPGCNPWEIMIKKFYFFQIIMNGWIRYQEDFILVKIYKWIIIRGIVLKMKRKNGPS